ncbi:MAG: IPT/TIG domain-containing protein, partial [Pseudomonadota bacterium]|nr:IPT/TIG domain-containing protein [Pseudomonadota bacterium]
GVQVSSIIDANDSTIIAIAGAHAEFTIGDIYILASTGAFTIKPSGWTYLSQQNISTVQPVRGQIGTNVVISGSGLLGGGRQIINVTLAGIAADVGSSNDSSVRVTASAGLGGTAGDVVLIANTGATTTSNDSWTYLDEGNIDSVSPSTGHGGTYVIISGDRLRGGGADVHDVTLAGETAFLVSQNDSTVVVRAAPSTVETQGHVILTADSGAVITRENGFSYIAPAVINSATPSSGQLNTIVTITGMRLRAHGAEVVRAALSGVDATIVSESNSQVVIQASASSGHDGSGRIILWSDTGAMVSRDDLWYYQNEGVISSVTPSTGQVGTEVVVEGTSLRGSGNAVVQVTLAGINSTIVQESTAALTVTAGASSAGRGDVVLYADTGATVTRSDGWTY